jgi:hypothetical protein
MATFIYCCPNTSLNVESPVADGPNQGRSEVYETLAHSTSNLLAMSMTLIDRMDVVRHKITRRVALAGLFDAAAVAEARAQIAQANTAAAALDEQMAEHAAKIERETAEHTE